MAIFERETREKIVFEIRDWQGKRCGVILDEFRAS